MKQLADIQSILTAKAEAEARSNAWSLVNKFKESLIELTGSLGGITITLIREDGTIVDTANIVTVLNQILEAVTPSAKAKAVEEAAHDFIKKVAALEAELEEFRNQINL